MRRDGDSFPTLCRLKPPEGSASNSQLETLRKNSSSFRWFEAPSAATRGVSAQLDHRRRAGAPGAL